MLVGLIPLETYAMAQPKMLRYNAFMRQATLHSIIADIQAIRNRDNGGFWVNTDNIGSGYDVRYKSIGWMDTR